MDGKIYSQKLGLAEIDGKKISVVPLKGPYMPAVGDLVVGQVVDVSMGGWHVDINAPYTAILSVSEVKGKPFGPRLEALTRIFGIGETLVAKVVAFDRTRDPALTIQGPGLGKVRDGVVVGLTPTKIPRLIGRKGSMISMIKWESGCEIVVGQNGKIHISGTDPKKIDLAIRAVRMVEEQAHTAGLTDRIKAFLEAEQRGES